MIVVCTSNLQTTELNVEIDRNSPLTVQPGVFKTPALRGDCTVDLKEYAAAVTGYIRKYKENYPH